MSGFVGYCTIEVTDSQMSLAFPLAVLYPTYMPGKEETVSFYTLDVARDAPIEEGLFPLVFISHGKGSSPWVYRTLAHHLAHNGFIVGLPEHPFNNRDDNTWHGTVQNLIARPRHLQLAIDQVSSHPQFALSVKPAAVAVVGHSMGGYTALALAGGIPTSFPNESPDGQAQLLSTTTDHRLKALVLLAPATAWFRADGALRNVTLPILLIEAEKDEHTTPEHGQLVVHGVADKSCVQHRIVENAGHFSFLSAFPAARVSPAFPPSQDPPGFDRTSFHTALNAEVAAFLASHT
ncbi:alpha/beta hydrolase family protein [Hymenobacter sp.]|jgi:predicted dienelactone hydrolase|uniref:alpha/beta hydrolase family protein n=1 Tax=Hymenobacter sp. TaxID=1898978 RepID=UPI002EDB9979